MTADRVAHQHPQSAIEVVYEFFGQSTTRLWRAQTNCGSMQCKKCAKEDGDRCVQRLGLDVGKMAAAKNFKRSGDDEEAQRDHDRIYEELQNKICYDAIFLSRHNNSQKCT